MPERVLLWDFDGTLGWREGGWTGTLLALLQEQGWALDVSADQLRPHLSQGFRWDLHHRAHAPATDPDLWWRELEPVLRRAVTQVGVPAAGADHAARHFRGRFLTYSAWRSFPDVAPCLRALAQAGWIQDVASNNFPEFEQVLLQLGLRPFFRRVHCSAQIGYEKPHPGFYRAATAGLAQDADVWMLGDNVEADYLGGQAAGLKTVLLRKPSPLAKTYLPDLAGLPALLAGDRP
ncbi:MAG TPA: HAD-IA family hydrolase [bacterium]|nr:HAD-IA family hydrolase [bacterium]